MRWRARRWTCASSATTTARPICSLIDVGGEVLAISQFTLFADTRKGRRPSFLDAAPPEMGKRLYETFCAAVEERGVKVARGIFGAEMQVELVNDGPMTIWLDSADG